MVKVVGKSENGSIPTNSLQNKCEIGIRGNKGFPSDPGIYVPKTFFDEIQAKISEYSFSSLSQCQVNKVDDTCIEVVTGILDRHHDHLQVYIKKVDDHYLLSDGGYIFSDIDVDLVDKDDLLKIKNKLQDRLYVSINDHNEITLLTNKHDFFVNLQNMIKAQISACVLL
ncbi:DUF1828 domain-containing protein [Commensalibacter oyaizuii]|uniref:DUF1828 domain-containing protein n=1 Tax=Commensalibacter oyaizuii TaxID=3043873 RepID=A0ABT6Q3H4_9PROT|nr:DUF1828 domain-containing protein [Commensalibacter sp. TBRC 16381]MDI2091644.1 DUF1828 domain-containing protein [Commensalibacter sp. TBRC 16381]